MRRMRLGRGKTERGRGLHWSDAGTCYSPENSLPAGIQSPDGRPPPLQPPTDSYGLHLIIDYTLTQLHSRFRFTYLRFRFTYLRFRFSIPPISIFRITSQSSGEGQSVVYNPIPRQREITVVNSISRFGTSIALESTEDRGKMIYSRI
ncbi:hypothetical protein LXL04_003041 [Taraxacum kok-saghyz]